MTLIDLLDAEGLTAECGRCPYLRVRHERTAPDIVEQVRQCGAELDTDCPRWRALEDK